MLLENGNVIVQFVFQKKYNFFLIYLPLFMIVVRFFKIKGSSHIFIRS